MRTFSSWVDIHVYVWNNAKIKICAAHKYLIVFATLFLRIVAVWVCLCVSVCAKMLLKYTLRWLAFLTAWWRARIFRINTHTVSTPSNILSRSVRSHRGGYAIAADIVFRAENDKFCLTAEKVSLRAFFYFYEYIYKRI